MFKVIDDVPHRFAWEKNMKLIQIHKKIEKVK